MASPSERLSTYIRTRLDHARRRDEPFIETLVSKTRTIDPALRTLFWANFIIPAVFTLFIRRIGFWVQMAATAPLGAVADGAGDPLYAEKTRSFVLQYFTAELLILTFIVVQAINLKSMQSYPERRRLLLFVFAANFLALPLGGVGILPMLFSFPFDAATIAINLWRFY